MKARTRSSCAAVLNSQSASLSLLAPTRLLKPAEKPSVSVFQFWIFAYSVQRGSS